MKDRIKVHRFLPLNVVEKGRTPFSAKMVPSKPVLSCNEVAFGMTIVLPGFASRAGQGLAILTNVDGSWETN
jgi:hypothetical protein